MKKIAKLSLLIFVLGSLLYLSGCVSLGAPFAKVQSIPPDKALVYIYRSSAFVGGGMSYDVYANDKLIMALHNGGYYPYFADPGKIEIWARTESKSSVTFLAEAGKTYYVKGSIGFGVLVGRPHLEIVKAEKAGTEISQTKKIPDLTKEDLAARKKEETDF